MPWRAAVLTLREEVGSRDLWGRDGRPFCGLALVVLLILVGLQGAWIDEPFDASAGGIVSGQFVAYTVRAFSEIGLDRSGLVWSQFFHPDAIELLVPYLNHPVFSLLILYPSYEVGGRDERALRLPVLLIAVIGIVALFVLVRRCDRSVAAGVAAALFASAPLMVQHAMILCPFGIIGTSFVLGTAAAWFAWRLRGGRRRYLLFALLGLISLGMDWVAGFLLPGLLASVGLERGVRGRWRAGVATAFPYLLGIVLLGLWFVRGAGGVAEAQEHLRVMRMRLAGYPGGLERWLATMGDYVLRGFGWPLILLAVVGTGCAVARSLRVPVPPLTRCSIALLLAGVLPSLVFFSRAASHEFWILPALPAVAVLAASGAETLCGLWPIAGRGKGKLLLAVTILAAGVGIWSGVGLHLAHRSDRDPRRAEALDTAAGRGDVVLLVDVGNSVPYYAAASVMTLPGADRHVFDQAVRHLRRGRDAIGRIILAVPDHALASAGAWVGTLPLVPESVREITGPDTSLLVGELDPVRLFDR